MKLCVLFRLNGVSVSRLPMIHAAPSRETEQPRGLGGEEECFPGNLADCFVTSCSTKYIHACMHHQRRRRYSTLLFRLPPTNRSPLNPSVHRGFSHRWPGEEEEEEGEKFPRNNRRIVFNDKAQISVEFLPLISPRRDFWFAIDQESRMTRIFLREKKKRELKGKRENFYKEYPVWKDRFEKSTGSTGSNVVSRTSI